MPGTGPPPATHHPQPATLDLVASLVDKNLLRQAPGRGERTRYEMLEVVREYAWEQLAESGEESEVHRRHAAWCIEMAERSWASWIAAIDLPLLDAMSAEHDNMRAALTWLADNDDLVNWLRLAAALCPFWYFRSHRAEGRRWLERGLSAAATAEVPLLVRARALHGAAILYEAEPAAEAYLEEGLPLWRELGDRLYTGSSLAMLGILACTRGEYARAAVLADEALATIGSSNAIWVSVAQLVRGRVAFGLGEPKEAARWLSESLAVARAEGDVHGVGIALYHLALVLLSARDAKAAAPLLTESLGIWREIARLEGLAHTLAEVAMLAAMTGQPAAARLWGAVAALRQVLGYEFWLPERDIFAQAEAALRREIGASVFEREFAAGQALGLDEALAEADAVIANAVASEAEIVESQPAFGLTPRELEVLRLVVAGKSDREIAEALAISRRTAEGHVARILGKLDVRSRAAAVALALSSGIVPSTHT